MDYEIPFPILFNCWKHHAAFIRQQIALSNENNHEDFQRLIKNLLLIGGSQMDLYTGNLPPPEIGLEILHQLNDKIKLELSSYKEWLYSGNKNYKKLTIVDDSSWTLRLGNDEQRYVHIHPSRYSPYSVRVKATTLKTAIAFLSWQKINKEKLVTLEMINFVRKKFLNECSVKSLTSSSGITNVIKLLGMK